MVEEKSDLYKGILPGLLNHQGIFYIYVKHLELMVENILGLEKSIC